VTILQLDEYTKYFSV